MVLLGTVWADTEIFACRLRGPTTCGDRRHAGRPRATWGELDQGQPGGRGGAGVVIFRHGQWSDFDVVSGQVVR